MEQEVHITLWLEIAIGQVATGQVGLDEFAYELKALRHGLIVRWLSESQRGACFTCPGIPKAFLS